MAGKVPSMNLRAAREIGANLDQWRRLLGVQVRTLAEQARVSKTTISKVLAGDPSVSFATYLCVFRSLGILDAVVDATDPSDTPLARARAEETIPKHVYPHKGIDLP